MAGYRVPPAPLAALAYKEARGQTVAPEHRVPPACRGQMARSDLLARSDPLAYKVSRG